jgi:hypothetical protein
MKKIILSSLICLISISAHSEFTQKKCEDVLTHSGDILIQRRWDSTSNHCFIGLHPMKVTDLKYRDYYFDNSGIFFVFNSYGEGSDASTTGSRVFYLFPITQNYPDYSIEPNGDVIIQTVSGYQILFDSKKLQIKSVQSGQFIESPLSPNNRGGTEINPGTGFLFDAGFKLGGMAKDQPTNLTQVTGAKSGTCRLKNSELYQYKSGDDEHPLLYSGKNLELFLQKRCNIQF